MQEQVIGGMESTLELSEAVVTRPCGASASRQPRPLLVLGIGEILLWDEGVGVCVIEEGLEPSAEVSAVVPELVRLALAELDQCLIANASCSYCEQEASEDVDSGDPLVSTEQRRLLHRTAFDRPQWCAWLRCARLD